MCVCVCVCVWSPIECVCMGNRLDNTAYENEGGGGGIRALTCWAISSTRLCFCWPIINPSRSSWKLRSLFLLSCNLFCTPSLLQFTVNNTRANKYQQRTSMSTLFTYYSSHAGSSLLNESFRDRMFILGLANNCILRSSECIRPAHAHMHLRKCAHQSVNR